MADRNAGSVASLEADLRRLGVPLEGLDIAWTANVRDETEAVIAELRKDSRFPSALPATAAWSELQWQDRES